MNIYIGNPSQEAINANEEFLEQFKIKKGKIMNRDALTLLARSVKDRSDGQVTLTIRYDGEEADMKAHVTHIQMLDLSSHDEKDIGVDEVTFKACI